MKVFHGNEIKIFHINERIVLILFIFFLLQQYSFSKRTSLASAQGIHGSVDYTWEKRQIEGEKTTRFTQIYDMIIARGLPRLYDTSVKLQFRAETEGEREERKAQLLPVININLGNPTVNMGLGWTSDNIEYEKGETYKNERFYSTLKWQPKWLPRMLAQYWTEKTDRSRNSDIEEKEDNLSFMEDYSVKIGHLNIIHSYNTRRKDTDNEIETTYDLSNKARIGHRFAFFDDRLDIGTKYEFNHGKNKQDNGTKNTMLGHNGNISLSTTPYSWMSTYYKFLFGTVRETEPEKRDTSVGHNLSFLLSPFKFLTTEIGGNHNRYTETNNGSARERTNYSLKLSPQIPGLFFDPNRNHIYPIKSYLLISRSSERETDNTRGRTLSFLINGSTILYRGVDIGAEIGSSKTEYNAQDLSRSEIWFDTSFHLRLTPALTGSVKQKNRWKRYTGAREKDFEGEVETKLTYRPVQTFLLKLGNTLDYGDGRSSYDFSLGWRPENRKTEINLQYHSGNKDEKKYFLGQFNLNVSDAIQFRFQYQYPSVEERLIIKFTLNF